MAQDFIPDYMRECKYQVFTKTAEFFVGPVQAGQILSNKFDSAKNGSKTIESNGFVRETTLDEIKILCRIAEES